MDDFCRMRNRGTSLVARKSQKLHFLSSVDCIILPDSENSLSVVAHERLKGPPPWNPRLEPTNVASHAGRDSHFQGVAPKNGALQRAIVESKRNDTKDGNRKTKRLFFPCSPIDLVFLSLHCLLLSPFHLYLSMDLRHLTLVSCFRFQLPPRLLLRKES